jgi:hypothetical protein
MKASHNLSARLRDMQHWLNSLIAKQVNRRVHVERRIKAITANPHTTYQTLFAAHPTLATLLTNKKQPPTSKHAPANTCAYK